MNEVIASGKADIINLGRQSLADPFFAKKAFAGNDDDITRCLRCGTCFANSTTSGIFYCAVNPVIGFEADNLNGLNKISGEDDVKNVLVVGGGVAGMQAAITAYDRGHYVTLVEKSDKLGGVLRCEDNVPFKNKLKMYLDAQELRVKSRDIVVYYNTEVTPELVQKIEPDVIIAALGSRPVIPKIEGIEKARLAEEVYQNPDLAGKSTVIMGGGLVGLELGLFLAQKGVKINVVEMLPYTIATMGQVEVSNRISNSSAIEPGTNVVHGDALGYEIRKFGDDYKIRHSTKAVKVTDDGLIVENADGREEIKADCVICAVGYAGLTTEAFALAEYAREFYVVGDCVQPKNIQFATRDAFQIAKDI